MESKNNRFERNHLDRYHAGTDSDEAKFKVNIPLLNKMMNSKLAIFEMLKIRRKSDKIKNKMKQNESIV